jgi:hypothetical protein
VSRDLVLVLINAVIAQDGVEIFPSAY